MNILVTGGLGHIGSSLIRSISKQKNIKNIYIVDNLVSNRYCSLFDLPNHKKFSFLNIDVSKCIISNLPKSDIVIHLAAKTDAAQSHKLEKEFKKNFKATKNIIEYCKKFRSKLIFASSTSVYGPQSLVVSENCKNSELNPQSPYASIKLKEEKLIKKNFKKENSYLILRLGTIYGFSEGIRFHTAINKFCLQACMNLKLTIWKTAYNQKRPYLGLDDFNLAIIHIIKKNLINNETYNILSHNLTVKDIVKAIDKNIKTKLSYVNNPIMNQLSYVVENKKFINTGFKFKSNINLEIKKTIKKLININ